jgi:acyl-CoA thioesterase
MTNNKTAFFSSDGNYLVANDSARGPWSADACHAGPVSGLLARAAEAAVSDKQLVKLTVNFIRPVPMNGIRIEFDVTQDGRVVTSTALTAVDRDGKVCARATTTHIVLEDTGDLSTPVTSPPQTSDDAPVDFIVSRVPHGKPFISNFVEVRVPPGTSQALGPNTIWMRTPALLEGETPSPFQQACPLADCANAISRNHELTEFSFVNSDITVALHRLPESDWLASKAISHWRSNGIGMSHATLFDEIGEIGFALQSLVLRPLQR